jgi:predicted RNA-binding Zn ribbon-like protein
MMWTLSVISSGAVVGEAVSRVWLLPDEPVPIRLMTTIWADTEGIHDDLRTPEDLESWLDAVGLDRAGIAATADDLARARGLRDAARRLAAQVTGDGREAAASPIASLDDAINEVNTIAAASPPPALAWRHEQLERTVAAGASPVSVGLAQVAEDVIELLDGEEAANLRACHAPGCVLYFVKAHPRRQWCSIACGNRARAARHYQRVRSPR